MRVLGAEVPRALPAVVGSVGWPLTVIVLAACTVSWLSLRRRDVE